ncbi:shikimate kinase, partial [Mesorhizobium sp. M1E.F.Ca.ET.063.01.1.1]|uniref:shikimate kinase n=1 Tax=Mesorhizobium sp. M1E.F.Ca.ET.063.01.1.1 TaxID=2496750 RepID=UPI000FD23FE9
MNALPANPPDEGRVALLERLGSRSIIFVGLMGAGKTAIGRKVAAMLSLPFIDSDQEIESVSRMTVPELFERDTAFVRRICWQRVHAEPLLRRIDIKSLFASSTA